MVRAVKTIRTCRRDITQRANTCFARYNPRPSNPVNTRIREVGAGVAGGANTAIRIAQELVAEALSESTTLGV